MPDFKQCPMCKSGWNLAENFLADPSITLHGYKVCFDNLMDGSLLFIHGDSRCYSVFSMRIGDFSFLSSSSPSPGLKAGTKRCPSKCLKQNDLSPCPVNCSGAMVREIIQKILKYPKQMPSIKPNNNSQCQRI